VSSFKAELVISKHTVNARASSDLFTVIVIRLALTATVVDSVSESWV